LEGCTLSKGDGYGSFFFYPQQDKKIKFPPKKENKIPKEPLQISKSYIGTY
jgi:hypothetical protein